MPFSCGNHASSLTSTMMILDKYYAIERVHEKEEMNDFMSTHGWKRGAKFISDDGGDDDGT